MDSSQEGPCTTRTFVVSGTAAAIQAAHIAHLRRPRTGRIKRSQGIMFCSSCESKQHSRKRLEGLAFRAHGTRHTAHDHIDHIRRRGRPTAGRAPLCSTSLTWDTQRAARSAANDGTLIVAIEASASFKVSTIPPYSSTKSIQYSSLVSEDHPYRGVGLGPASPGVARVCATPAVYHTPLCVLTSL